MWQNVDVYVRIIKIPIPKIAVVNYRDFDYVLTTIACTDLPHFASHAGFWWNYVHRANHGIRCKIAQNAAVWGIVERIIRMVKILFVCHGSRRGESLVAAVSGQTAANRCNRDRGVLRFYYDWGTQNKKCKSSGLRTGNSVFRPFVLFRYVH